MIKTVTDPLTIANELRPLLLRLSRQLRREVHELDLTAGQVSILGHVFHHPGMGIRALAELEGVSQPRMSKAVDELLVAGLLTRDRAEDRRRVGVELTPEGAAVIRSVKRRRTAWLADRLGCLTPDELAALEAALPGLARLVDETE